ncbi:MAG: hypothetical protein WC657_04985 [Candidatus Paceibacterota bacterium]|jgi:hypothetical protein
MDWTEHYTKTAENFSLQMNFIHTLQEQTKHIRNLRVLDFGAGPIPHTVSIYGRLQEDQETTVAYDPELTISSPSSENTFEPEVKWTNRAPTGETFHLVICNFSLHHAGGDLNSIIKGLASYSPEMIGITDYDFTQATREDFERTFISQQEIKELNTLFRGDLQACFDYHRRLGLNDFKRGLQESGFNLVASKPGDKIAQYKFFLIGKKG